MNKSSSNPSLIQTSSSTVPPSSPSYYNKVMTKSKIGNNYDEKKNSGGGGSAIDGGVNHHKNTTSTIRVDERDNFILSKDIFLRILFACVGIGLVCGYLLFYSFYRSKCNALLSNVTQQHEKSFNEQKLLLQATNSATSLSTDTTNLSKERAMLEQQTVLVSKHQELLQTHETTLVRLSDMQKVNEISKDTIEQQKVDIQNLQKQIKDTEKLIDDAKRQAKKEQDRIQSQLRLTKSMLQEKIDEVEDLKSKLEEEEEEENLDGGIPTSQKSIDNNNDAIIKMQASIRRRSIAETITNYGDGPYIVMFLINNARTGAISFEIEIDKFADMPHTVHTFLSLINAGLYHETSITVQQEQQQKSTTTTIIITGGHPSTSRTKQTQSKLIRKYAELGYSIDSPLLFTEQTTKSCPNGGINMIQNGSNFSITLLSNNNNDDDEEEENNLSYNCFGKIISGLDELYQYKPGERINIVDARIIPSSSSSNDDDSNSNDEL